MATSLDLNNILTQVKKLNVEDQSNLLQQLMILPKKSKVKMTNSKKLSSISGLGKEIWSNVDIDSLIETEREW
ncbi:MAG TPA: hypothetical protein VF623_01265 [Segetibacter sp.]